MDDYITVAQYAKAKGITKQAVYQQLNKQLKGLVKEIDGKKMLSINALTEEERNRLEQVGNQELNNNFQNLNKENQGQDITKDLVDMLREQLEEKDQQIRLLQQMNKENQGQDITKDLVDMLQAQLEAKDNQIAELMLEIKESRRGLEALNAGTVNILQPPKAGKMPTEVVEVAQDPENPSEAGETAQAGKKSVWARLFRRSK